MKNKTINELTSLENPRLTDTLPIWDGTEGKTKKVSLAKIPANVITLVDSLPESPNILDRVYRYNNKYYVGNESAQTLTELALKADIPTVVDTIENGNLHPVTSNAVYDALMAVTSGTAVNDSDCVINYIKYGKLILFQIHALTSLTEASKTIPFTCVHNGEGNKCSMLWSSELRGESYLNSPTTIKVSVSAESSGMIPCILA